MKLYDFDEIDDKLELLPMAARRALDRAGLKLSLEAWQSLAHPVRKNLVELGGGGDVDVSGVKRELSGASVPVEPIEPKADPPADRVPEQVRSAYAEQGPISDSTWAALKPLDRYCLNKLARKGKKKRMAKAFAEIVGASATSPHLAAGGGVRMVSVSDKPETVRRAQAESFVSMNEVAFEALSRNQAPKGDVLATARLAGIMAAKNTSNLVPLCHPLSLSHVGIDLDLMPAERQVKVTTSVEVTARTGVEMEALCAASVASLTIYDMLKAFDRKMVIGPTQLVAKSGGRSGDYRR